ncbi:hypothetical protein [Hymenobacter edaphi]|uniref:Uncharacterized protein n=1 Tax=Hymenobacter edaphi TaxID=2211146 RepID=A0A328BA29_9BACT|nr:hypothetical protein [Hymenobacter edaphi]RAK63545.1 hypothetical protein DLM85_21325 [Hymenobacter edaphi]
MPLLHQEVPPQSMVVINNAAFLNAAAPRLEFQAFVARYQPVLESQRKHEGAGLTMFEYRTYRLGDDKIVYAREARGSSLIRLMHFTLVTSQVALPRNVRIGMSKHAFEVAFHHKVPGDAAMVTEATYIPCRRYTFTFEHQKLVKIDYELLLA